HRVPGSAGGGFDPSAGIEFLAADFDQFGLVIERVHLAGAAVHEKLDDPFDPRAMVQAAVQFGPAVSNWDGVGQKALFADKLGQCDAAETAAKTPEEFPAGQVTVSEERMHPVKFKV